MMASIVQLEKGRGPETVRVLRSVRAYHSRNEEQPRLLHEGSSSCLKAGKHKNDRDEDVFVLRW